MRASRSNAAQMRMLLPGPRATAAAFRAAGPCGNRVPHERERERRRAGRRACATPPTRSRASRAARRAAASATARSAAGVVEQRAPARAHPRARDTAGVDERVDLRGRARPPAGHRPRRPRAQAVPLPRRLARAARRHEVRPHARVRLDAAAPARADRERSRPARPAARARARGGRPSRRRDADPRRQRGVPARRTAPSARRRCARGTRRWRAAHHGGVQGQVRQAAAAPSSPTAASPARCSSCTTSPGASCSSTSTSDGERRPVRSDDVNDYLREVSGAEITVKDFRTWGASALCLRALNDLDPPASPTAAKRAIAEAIRDVATALGNTPAVCRASYVHPGILESFAAGELPRAARAPPARARPLGVGPAQVPARALMTRRRRRLDRAQQIGRADGTCGSTGARPRRASSSISSAPRDRLDLVVIAEQPGVGGIAHDCASRCREDAAVEFAERVRPGRDRTRCSRSRAEAFPLRSETGRTTKP